MNSKNLVALWIDLAEFGCSELSFRSALFQGQTLQTCVEYKVGGGEKSKLSRLFSRTELIHSYKGMGARDFKSSIALPPPDVSLVVDCLWKDHRSIPP